MTSESLEWHRERAAERLAVDAAQATIPDVYSCVRSIAGAQLQDRTRIHEIQEQLDRIEAKLDSLLARGEHATQSPG